MSKTILMIVGGVAGTAAVAGGATAGAIVSQSQPTATNQDQTLATQKAEAVATLVKDHSFDKSKSATSQFPAVNTILTDTQLSLLGLEKTVDGYAVEVKVSAISNASVTFEITVTKDGVSANTTVEVSGFSTVETDERVSALINTIANKNFVINATKLTVDAFITKVNSTTEASEQLSEVVALNTDLSNNKVLLTNNLNSLTVLKNASGNLFVNLNLNNGNTTENVSFTLTGWYDAQADLDSKADALVGSYAAVESVTVNAFVEKTNAENFASQLVDFSENMTDLIISSLALAEAVTDESTSVVYSVNVQLVGFELTKTVTVTVTGLLANSSVTTDPGTNDGSDTTTPGTNDGSDTTTPGNSDGSDTTTPGTDDGSSTTTPGTDDGSNTTTPGTDEGSNTTTPGEDTPSEPTVSAEQLQFNVIATSLEGQSFTVTEEVGVNDFVSGITATSLKKLLGAKFTSVLSTATIQTVSATASADNTTAANVSATLTFGTLEAKTVNFTVTGLVAQSVVDANTKLSDTVKNLSGKSFASLEFTYAPDFIKTLNTDNIVEKLNASFKTALGEAKISSLLASNNITNTVTTVVLNLTYPGTEKTASATIIITGLDSQTQMMKDQIALQLIVNRINTIAFAVPNDETTIEAFKAGASSNDSVNYLKTVLGETFTSKLDSATISNISVGTFYLGVPLSVNLKVTYGEASRTIQLYVTGLTTQDALDKKAKIAQVEELVASLNGKKFPVSAEQSKLNVNDFTNNFKNDNNLQYLTAEFYDQIKDWSPILWATSFTYITGTAVSVNVALSPYVGAEKIVVKNVEFTGLQPYGVSNGNEWMQNQLQTGLATNLEAIKAISYSKVESPLTVDRYYETVLKPLSAEQQLEAVAKLLHWDQKQVALIKNLPIDTTSIDTIDSYNVTFSFSYSEEIGNLVMTISATASGFSYNKKQTFGATTSIELSDFVSFAKGHYVDPTPFVTEVNTSTFKLNNSKLASQWVSYYSAFDSLTEQVTDINQQINSPALTKLLSLSMGVENLTYRVDGLYKLIVEATLKFNDVTTQKVILNITVDQPEYLTVQTSENVVYNYELAKVFDVANMRDGVDQLIKIFEKYDSDVSRIAVQSIKDFGVDIDSVDWQPVSEGSRDGILITLYRFVDGHLKAHKVAFTVYPLVGFEIADYIQTMKTKAAFDMGLAKYIMQTYNKITWQTPDDQRVFVKGTDPWRLFWTGRRDYIDLIPFLTTENGLKTVILTPVDKEWNDWSTATFKYELVSKEGNSQTILIKNYPMVSNGVFKGAPADWQITPIKF